MPPTSLHVTSDSYVLCTLLCQNYDQYQPSPWLTEVDPKSSPYYPQVGDAVSVLRYLHLVVDTLHNLKVRKTVSTFYFTSTFGWVVITCSQTAAIYLVVVCAVSISTQLCVLQLLALEAIAGTCRHSACTACIRIPYLAPCAGQSDEYNVHFLLFPQVMYFRQGHEQYLQAVRRELVFSTRGMLLPWQLLDLRVSLGCWSHYIHLYLLALYCFF